MMKLVTEVLTNPNKHLASLLPQESPCKLQFHHVQKPVRQAIAKQNQLDVVGHFTEGNYWSLH